MVVDGVNDLHLGRGRLLTSSTTLHHGRGGPSTPSTRVHPARRRGPTTSTLDRTPCGRLLASSTCSRLFRHSLAASG
jgi:hypothetical protein